MSSVYPSEQEIWRKSTSKGTRQDTLHLHFRREESIFLAGVCLLYLKDGELRILIAVGLGGIYSGGAHQAFNQLRGFKLAGHDVTAVWGPDVNGDPHGFDILKELQIPFQIMPIDKKWTIASLKQFRKILVDFKPDVVECFKGGAQYHALYGGIGLNRHALIFYRGIGLDMDLWQGLKYRLSRVDRVIANCNDLREIMIKTGKIPAEKVDFIYGEYHSTLQDLDSVDITTLRQELNISESVTLITQFGNWATWRGQGTTLEAAQQLKEKGYQFHLLFCGNGTDNLAEQVERLGLTEYVTLSPYRRDPERVLKACDIMVNASTSHESFPGSLVNGHAAGLPAVATTMPGSGEIIVEGETGYLIPINDPDSLANALEQMLNMSPEQLAQMGKKARQRALKFFSSEARTEKRLECYRKAIAHRRR